MSIEGKREIRIFIVLFLYIFIFFFLIDKPFYFQ